ncbi:MAG: hypothetical protein ACJ73S_09480 [Mycobacteriales bacterium]
MRTLRAAVAAVVVGAGLAGCGSGGGGSGRVAASSREVSFVVDGTRAYGTLDVPAHRRGRRLAAALLLAGSGNTDRDGNQKPRLTPDTLKQVAGALDRMGIASLRFDKYFAGRTGPGRYAADPGSIDLDAFLRQAGGAYRLLAGEPVTDRRRLLVVGHSEGGMYALLLAGSVTPRPAGLALVEPQDERILDLVALQLEEGLDRQVSAGAIGADVARRNVEGVRQAVADFRAGRPPNTAGLLPSVTSVLATFVLSPANVRYTRTDDAVYVPDHAAKLPRGTRVLVTDGTADSNVPPSTIRPLVDALASAGASGPGLVTLDGLNHDLNPAGTRPNGAPLAPAFLAALRGWARPYATAS